MKKIFVAIILMASCAFVINAQEIDSTEYIEPIEYYDSVPQVENVEVPDMVIEVNPVKETIDLALPDSLSAYVVQVPIRSNIDNSLMGCFKSYTNTTNNAKNVNVNISRGTVPPVHNQENNPLGITEEAFSYQGYNGKITTKPFSKSITISLVVNEVVVIVTTTKTLDKEDAIAFLNKIDLSRLSTL
jgi:hypothetical protein